VWVGRLGEPKRQFGGLNRVKVLLWAIGCICSLYCLGYFLLMERDVYAHDSRGFPIFSSSSRLSDHVRVGDGLSLYVRRDGLLNTIFLPLDYVFCDMSAFRERQAEYRASGLFGD
jgi:hypothetical protein